jgi:hypothetical protein
MTIAALYVDPRGPYPALAGVDAWAVDRDATQYDGPDPVVAHPPCAPWTRSAALRASYKGDEQALALRAVAQVRQFGGVLEHPAHSMLWAAACLPAPGDSPSVDPNGYTIRVDQCEWGHVARKSTWLYLVGVPREALEAPPFPGRKPTHWASGSRGKSSRTGAPVPPGIKVCSAEQRRRTPPLFAEYLVRLAEAARR